MDLIGLLTTFYLAGAGMVLMLICWVGWHNVIAYRAIAGIVFWPILLIVLLVERRHPRA